MFPGHFTPQQYLPTSLLGTEFYEPSDQGYEAKIAERVAGWREKTRQAFESAIKEQQAAEAKKKPAA
jgi:putative ATPase